MKGSNWLTRTLASQRCFSVEAGPPQEAWTARRRAGQRARRARVPRAKRTVRGWGADMNFFFSCPSRCDDLLIWGCVDVSSVSMIDGSGR